MNAGRTILVTGGSGLLGRLVVERLRSVGHRVRVLTHRPHRTTTWSRETYGRAPAWARPARVWTRCALRHGHPGLRRGGRDRNPAARRRRLARGQPAAGARVDRGVDRIPWRYYGAKLDAERLVASSGLPWTIQRATQFHPFLSAMLDRLARPPVLVAPRSFRFQPVDPADVADRLVQHVASGAVGRAPDFGGPEVLAATGLASAWLRASGRRRPIVRVPVPGSLGRAFRPGANLCPEHADGRRTWQEFLDTSVGAPD